MYSYEDRIKAVQLYIKYDRSAAATVQKLGYPSRKNLRRWYRTYVETGGLLKQARRKPKYSTEQKQRAVDYYFSHGCCLARTKKALGYPSSATLNNWIDVLQPGARKCSNKASALSRDEKQHAVIKLCSRRETAAAVAGKLGVSRGVLYKWRKQLLGEEVSPPMNVVRILYQVTNRMT